MRKDLRVFERKRNISLDIVYALDISGSMHGRKIDAGKKAAVGLALMGTRVGDRVGVVAFNTSVYIISPPTANVRHIAHRIVSLSPSSGTDIALAVAESVRLLHEYSDPERGKHIILITDAIPTSGSDDPVERTYRE
mgnify:CR=1 FL=1